MMAAVSKLSTQTQRAVRKASSSRSASFKLADVMQQLVTQTTASEQQWKRQQSERGMDIFETEYQGLKILLKSRAVFGQSSQIIPQRVEEWELRFAYPRKKEKVIDGAGLVFEPDSETSSIVPSSGQALIRQLIQAVYRSVQQLAQQQATHDFADVLPAIEALYHQAMDGQVASCVRHIPPSLLNPRAGGATVLEIGDRDNRLEVTSMRLHESQSVQITLRQGSVVRKLPKSAMQHPDIAACVEQLLALIQPPASL